MKKVVAVKLIIGLIAKDEALFLKAQKKIEKNFAEIDFKSEFFNFDYTNYYREELGSNLKRQFLSFKKLINPGKIYKIKIYAQKIEKLFCQAGKRRINIDPGYLDLAKLVLVTTKDFSHRIYLGQGIYAEVTLIYKNGAFQHLDWTYPDYRTDSYKKIFGTIRNIYHKQINETN
ncbi:MAG: DUF4416 family protein [Candidatus Omnitrophota bacterium]